MIVAEIKNKTVAFLKKQYEFFTKVVFRKTESFKFRKTAIATVVMIASVLLPIFAFSTLTLAYEVKYDDSIECNNALSPWNLRAKRPNNLITNETEACESWVIKLPC